MNAISCQYAILLTLLLGLCYIMILSSLQDYAATIFSDVYSTYIILPDLQNFTFVFL